MFMSNGFFRRLLQKENKPLSIGKLRFFLKNENQSLLNGLLFFFNALKVEMGIAGSMAGSVMAFLNCPIELLKVKLQTQDPKGVIGLKGKLEPPVCSREKTQSRLFI